MKELYKPSALLLAVLFMLSCFTGCGGAGSTDAVIKAIDGDAYSFDDSMGVSVHDPSIFKGQNGKYYVTGSHIAMAESDDLINWHTVSSGVYDSNKTLVPEGSTLREQYADAFKWCDGAQRLWERTEEDWETNVWASDVIYNEDMGKYCYYAASSVWGTTASVIWLATSDSPKGTYELQSCFLYSGFNKRTTVFGKPKNQLHYSFTNIGDLIDDGTFTKAAVEAKEWFDEDGNYDCSYGMYPNAIDPAAFYDENGELWLVYGSYSGGIYVMPLIEETGTPDYRAMAENSDYDMYFGKQISKTNEALNGTGEGPFITYDSQSGYYYLFLTYGGLAALDGYNIREYRSTSPDGPYTDSSDKDALSSENTGTKIIGNYQFSFNENAFLSAGHSSCLIDNDGNIYQAYHQRYNDGEGGYHNVQIHKMIRTNNGWLTMMPLAYNGEEETSVTLSDAAGSYELIIFDDMDIQSTDDFSTADSIITKAVTAELGENGVLKISGLGNGVLKMTGSDNGITCDITIGNDIYHGAFCMGTKPDGTSAMTLSAISDSGYTLWAVEK